jgi:hypothetical protein
MQVRTGDYNECRQDVFCSHDRTVISGITLAQALAQFLQENLSAKKTFFAES